LRTLWRSCGVALRVRGVGETRLGALACASCGERPARYIAVAFEEGKLFTPLCEECFRQAWETVGALMGEVAFRYVRLGDPNFLEKLVRLVNEEYSWRATAHEKCLEELGKLKGASGRIS